MTQKRNNDFFLNYDILRDNNPNILRLAVDSMSKVLGNATEKYKDTVFRMLLRDKTAALEIYNAMNNTNHSTPDDIIVTTLESAVYMGVRNDASFIIASQLMLYEQQSTVNPNMPLRDLQYIACIYAALTYEANVYGRKLIRLPEPKFVVFYNGTEEVPARYQMRLSDAFERQSDVPSLELIIDVLNINPGYNDGLLGKCSVLRGYMGFVNTVRDFQNDYPFDQAMELAIEYCIQNDILADFLNHNRAEVLRTSLFVYDQEKHIKMEKQESREEGRAEGREEGIIEGELRLLKQVVSNQISYGMSLDDIVKYTGIPKSKVEAVISMMKESVYKNKQ